MSQSRHIHWPVTCRKFRPVTPKNIGRCQKYHLLPAQVLGRWRLKKLRQAEHTHESVTAPTLAGHMRKISACHTKKHRPVSEISCSASTSTWQVTAQKVRQPQYTHESVPAHTLAGHRPKISACHTKKHRLVPEISSSASPKPYQVT